MDNQNNVSTDAVQINGPQVSEEQLRRTYKGVEFRTEEEKNQIVALEQEAAQYCENLSDKSYDELYAKHQEWSKLPSAIFMPYTIKVMSEIGEQEKKDIESYKAKIENASLEELEALKEEVAGKHYSDVAVSQIYSFLNVRKKECQIKILEDELVGYTSLSRQDLKALREKIYGKNFDTEITNTYVNKINAQYDIVEQNELQNLCANVENMNMKELEGALRIIANGGYQEKYSSSYILMINNRIEHLQYKELEALTEGIQDKTKQELEELYQQIEQGEYNAKFVKKFLLDIRMIIENRKYTEISELTADVCNKPKSEVLDIEKKVEETGYSNGVLLLPRKKIADKKFEFDMHELIDICNDFDSLSVEEVDNLISNVKEKGFSHKSLNIYLERLRQRKFNIALASVNKLSAYFVQLANKYGVGGGDILIASKSDAFTTAFKNLKAAHPNSGEFDVPAFIMSGSVNIAISYKYCYLNQGNKQALIEVNNINCFKTVKKLFIESMVVELKDGSTVPVSGSVNKQMVQAFLQMMNEFVMNVNNSVLIDSFVMPTFNVAPLSKDWYLCNNREHVLTKDELKNTTIGVVYTNEATTEMAKAMHFPGNKDWEQYQAKVKTNYQLLPDETLLFVYDKTLLNSAKEGFAVGEDKLFIKKPNQSVVTLTMKDIFEVKCDASGKICIDTTGTEQIVLDMVTASANCAAFVADKLDEYVKNMQLFATINQ